MNAAAAFTHKKIAEMPAAILSNWPAKPPLPAVATYSLQSFALPKSKPPHHATSSHTKKTAKTEKFITAMPAKKKTNTSSGKQPANQDTNVRRRISPTKEKPIPMPTV